MVFEYLVRFLVPLRFSSCMTVELKLLFRVSGKNLYSSMVLHQWLMVLLLHKLCDKIFYLLLDLR